MGNCHKKKENRGGYYRGSVSMVEEREVS